MNRVNIISDWFKPTKQITLPYSIDIHVDNFNVQQNDHCKIYIATEPRAIHPNHYEIIESNYMRFHKIITYDEELLKLPNAIKCVYGTTWVNPSNTFKQDNCRISFIVGGKNWTLGHRLRHFIYGRYKMVTQDLNIFLSTRSPMQNLYDVPVLLNDDKNNLFNDYAFHLCIENSRQNHYFTEKVMDCFQTMTVPIYWGAPNIGDYFDTRGMILLDTDDPDEIVRIINSIDLVSFYTRNIESIRSNYEMSMKYVDYSGRLVDIINAIVL